MYQTSADGSVSTRRWQAVAVMLLVALLPAGAYALGLGKLTLRSGLDQPLDGEIELISPTPQELKTLAASLASRADFENAGIERPLHLTYIKYTVMQRADGRYALHLTTDSPVREPFLHMLLQVEWTGGRMIREYTALLDPPQWTGGQPAGVEAPQAGGGSEESWPQFAGLPAPPPAAGLPPATMPGSDAASTPAPVSADAAPPQSEVARAAPPEAAPAGDQFPAPAPAPSEIVPVPAIAAAPEPARIAPTPVSGDWARTDSYGPVKRGETLGGITEQLRKDPGVSPEQAMLAILKTNPSAFFDSNVNNLKSGAILQVPERSVVEAIPKARARKEFRAQYDSWQEYKLKLAGASRAVAAPAQVALSGKSSAAAKLAEKAKPDTKADKAKTEKPKTADAVPSGTADQQLLKIVQRNLDDQRAEGNVAPGSKTTQPAAKQPGGEQRALAERVTTLEESLSSKELENKELKERLAKLQDQNKKAERLIEVENERLAKTQKQTAEAAAKKQQAETEAEAKKQAEAQKLADAKKQTESDAQKAAAALAAKKQPAVEQSKPDAAAKAGPDKPAAKPDAAKPGTKPAKPKPAPAPPPAAPGPGFLDNLPAVFADKSLMTTVGGIVALLGLAVFAIYFRRRRQAKVEFAESMMSSAGLADTTAATGQSGTAGGSSDTSFLSDFSQGGMGNIHADEVDPIAEAEVYLAYGRDEQAEEILKDAIVKDPGRQELKEKLLEIYHQRNDVGAFETLAEELYATLGGRGGKVWDRVEEMGRKLNPNNPMFRGGGPAPRVAAAPAAAFAAGAAFGAKPPVGAGMPGLGGGQPASDTGAGGLDFDLGSAPAPATPSALDMDFGEMTSEAPSSAPSFDLAFSAPEPAAPTPMEEPPAEADSGFNIDFQMDSGLTAAAPPAPETDLSMGMDTGLSGEAAGSGGDGLDLGGLDFNADSLGGGMESGGLDASGLDAGGLNFESDGGSDLSVGGDDMAWSGGDLGLEGEASGDDGLALSAEGGVEDNSQPWDETATKLDLAKAYIDMGDSEGARSILDEVLTEGSDDQKRQARELASQIAA